MRILIFHGYLLGGTGSNVYNAKLAEALVGLGHDVHLLCQDRSPERLDFVGATARWHEGRLDVLALRNPPGCTVYRPDIGPLLPVYVADRYEGVEARPFPDCSDDELARYVERNVAAVREVASLVAPAVALANHLIMGPMIMARGLATLNVPYVVKVHGSALEYTVKPYPERFLDAAREGVRGARAVLVGSRHTAQSLWGALSDEDLPERTRLGPPGVDVVEFGPRGPAAARAGLDRLTRQLDLKARESAPPARGARRGQAPDAFAAERGPTEDAFARDFAEAATALASLDFDRDRLVAFVGKLIVSKGVDLLIAAWPLVLARVPDARLVVVGFGAYRSGLLRLRAALASGDLAGARSLAERGRELEGGPAGPLRQLLDFLDGLAGSELERYRSSARRLMEGVVFAGRLEHAELADLLPACEAQVVPSTFPEAFGMVAVEAAACGTFPVSADHSGLAEVSHALSMSVPARAAGWLSFGLGPRSVRDLADRLANWLEAPDELRSATRDALVGTAQARFSWQGVAEGVIGAGLGRLVGPDPALGR